MKFLNKKNIAVTINLFCLFICIMIIPFILYHDVITNHDSNYIFQYTYNNNWIHSGRVLSKLISSFFYVFIPFVFKIHQNDISSFIIPIFISFCINIMALFILKIYYIFHNKNKFILQNLDFVFLYPVVYTIFSFIPTINENLNMFYLSGISETVVFFDDLFNLMFYIIFIYFIISSFFLKRNKFINSLYIINAFFLGFSYEALSFLSCIFYISILIYIGFIHKNKDFKCTEQNLRLLIIAGVSLFVSSFIHLFFSTYKQGQIQEYSVNFLDQINQISLYYIDFFKGLFNVIIMENIILLLIITILSILLFFIKDENKNNRKIIIFSTFIILSWLTYFLLLIIPGHCTVYHFDFWYSHPPARIMFYKTMIMIIILYFSYINKKKKLYSKIAKIILLIFLYSLVFISFAEIKREYLAERQDINGMRDKIYMSDKMVLLYNQLDGIALLPISWYKEYSTKRFIFRPRCYDAEENIRNKMKNIIDIEFNKKNSRLFTYLEENDYPLYIYYTYNIKPEGIIWVDDNIAFKEFERRGGFFTEKELKELIFTKLKKLKLKDLSLEEINSKIEQTPKESYLYATRARYYENNNQYIDAIKDYTTAIDLDRNNYKQYLYLRAKAYIKNKQYNEAEKDYISFINSSPYSIQIRKNLISLYLLQEKYENAIDEYKNLINIFEYYNENMKKTFYGDMAEIQYKLKLYPEVIETINKEEELTKYLANYQIRALAKIQLDDYDGAYNDIKKVYDYNLVNEQTKEIKQIIESKLQNKNNPI